MFFTIREEFILFGLNKYSQKRVIQILFDDDGIQFDKTVQPTFSKLQSCVDYVYVRTQTDALELSKLIRTCQSGVLAGEYALYRWEFPVKSSRETMYLGPIRMRIWRVQYVQYIGIWQRWLTWGSRGACESRHDSYVRLGSYL